MCRSLLSRVFLLLSLFFALQTISFAQNPDPTPDPQSTPQPTVHQRKDDVDEIKPAAPPADANAQAPVQTLDGDHDSADLPPFSLDLTDEASYFRMRDEHVRFLRGLMDKRFDPRARGQA